MANVGSLNIIIKSFVTKSEKKFWQTPQKPYIEIDSIIDWIIVDIRQAGKYLSRNLLYALCNYPDNASYYHLFFTYKYAIYFMNTFYEYSVVYDKISYKIYYALVYTFSNESHNESSCCI